MAQKPYNGLSGYIEHIVLMNRFALNVLMALTEATFTKEESISVTMDFLKGGPRTFTIPSFGSIINRVQEVERQMRRSLNLKAKDKGLPGSEGGLVIAEPDSIGSLDIPTHFHAKPNWFFETLLNPYLYINLDVSKYVSADSRNIEILRVILTLDTEEKRQWFNESIKGRNNIQYSQLVERMDVLGIVRNSDQETVTLPPSTLRYRGSFDILQVDLTPITTEGFSFARKYTLNSLAYTDNVEGVEGGKSLRKGDVLISESGDSSYSVTEVDYDTNIVTLGLRDGYEVLDIGVGKLRVGTTIRNEKQFQIGIGYSEKQVIFLRPIDPYFHVTPSQWGLGIGIDTSDLQIQTPEGLQSFEEFYSTSVHDVSSFFQGLSVDNQIPRAYGVKPDAPVLSNESFSVVRINNHRFAGIDGEEVNLKLRDKALLDQKKESYDELIRETDEALKVATDPTAQGVLQAKLDKYYAERSNIISRLSSTLDQLRIYGKDTFVGEIKEKYQVRGFWPIPESKFHTKTGSQEIIQFKYAYRYLDQAGDSKNVSSHDYVESNGDTRTAYFSEWVEVSGRLRGKIEDVLTGKFVWAPEDVSNADVENINQLAIPITPGEKVEVRIKAISEAGYPMNPIESDWSNIISIEFPENLRVDTERVREIAAIQQDATLSKNTFKMETQEAVIQNLSGKVASLQGDNEFLSNKVAELTMLVNKFVKGESLIYLLHDHNLGTPGKTDPFKIMTGAEKFSVQVVWNGVELAEGETEYEGATVKIQVTNDYVSWNDLYTVEIDSVSNFADPLVLSVQERYNYVRVVYENGTIADGNINIVLSY